MWLNQNDGSRQRVFFGADNVKEALDIINKKQHLTKEKIIVRQFNKKTEMYELFLTI
jgi:hypothetical protein